MGGSSAAVAWSQARFNRDVAAAEAAAEAGGGCEAALTPAAARVASSRVHQGGAKELAVDRGSGAGVRCKGKSALVAWSSCRLLAAARPFGRGMLLGTGCYWALDARWAACT